MFNDLKYSDEVPLDANYDKIYFFRAITNSPKLLAAPEKFYDYELKTIFLF